MSRWRERPAVVGLVGLLVCAVVLLGSMRLGDLPFVHDGRELRAEISDAGGLKVGDRVEVAGVDSGVVEDLAIRRDRVVVTFSVDRTLVLGESTGATVSVSSLLGTKVLRLEPAGPGRLDASAPIPLERTTPAYDVTTAFADLTTTVEQIDTDGLAEALDVVSDTFEGSGEDVEAAVRGLSALSRTVASRDVEVRSLLDGTRRLTGTLADSREDIATLVEDAALLLAEIDRRREVIDTLIENADALAVQVRGLVKDNEDQIGPALAEVDRVTTILLRRQAQLGESLSRLATFTRVFTNTIGNGPWFDSYIANVPDSVVVRGVTDR